MQALALVPISTQLDTPQVTRKFNFEVYKLMASGCYKKWLQGFMRAVKQGDYALAISCLKTLTCNEGLETEWDRLQIGGVSASVAKGTTKLLLTRFVSPLDGHYLLQQLKCWIDEEDEICFGFVNEYGGIEEVFPEIYLTIHKLFSGYSWN